jgi:hypothetical protein
VATSDLDPFKTPIDYFTINGQRSPGLAVISDASQPEKWEERQGYGLSGAVPIYRGRGLAKPVATIRLATPKDFTDWYVFRKLLARAPNARVPRALSIWHPWLQLADIKAVVVEHLGQPDYDEASGIYTVTVKFLEFRRLKLALAKPEAAAPPGPADRTEARIARLTADVSAATEGNATRGLGAIVDDVFDFDGLVNGLAGNR